MTKYDSRFVYENPRDAENELEIYIEDDAHWEPENRGRLCITVADEQAVDSYNSTFRCSVYLPKSEAKRLRDYLDALFPRGSSEPQP